MKITKKEEPYLFWLHNIPELSEKAAVLLLENCESPSQIYRMSRQELKEKLIGWGWMMRPSMSWRATWILSNTVRTAWKTTA